MPFDVTVPLRVKYGPAAGIPALALGEPGFTSDTYELYIGSSAGNKKIGPGILSLGGLTGATQTFADADDTNVTLAIGSSGTTHTFTMGWSGTLSIARGGTNSTTALNNGRVMISSGGAIVEATQPDAYTQTFSTATRTFNSYTADDESGAYTGIDNAQGGTPYAQVSELNALRVAYENLREFCENGFEVLNQVIDDLQARGDFQ